MLKKIKEKKVKENESCIGDVFNLSREEINADNTKSAEKVKKPKKQTHFAQGFCFHKLFWVFFVACFLGVVVETAFVFISTGQYQNRTGLVYGPFNLIYGFGALLMTLTMWWLRKERDIAMFFCGAVLGSVYEFFCSWLQETVLGTVSWEYSEMPFNLYGRINLLYSLFWGILALAWVKGIYPLMSKWIEKIPKKYGYPLTWILIIFMVFNSAVSGLAVWRMTERNDNIPANNVVMEYFDEKFPDERVQKVYPSMQYVEKTDKK